MSNPFPNRVEAVCLSGRAGHWALFWRGAGRSSAMTKAQATYAATAINQYEPPAIRTEGDEKCDGCAKMIDTESEGVIIAGKLLCMECQDGGYVAIHVFEEEVKAHEALKRAILLAEEETT